MNVYGSLKQLGTLAGARYHCLDNVEVYSKHLNGILMKPEATKILRCEQALTQAVCKGAIGCGVKYSYSYEA